MRRIGWMLFGIIVGGLLMWGAMQYHVLRTNDGFTYVPKRHAMLFETYLDVRAWTLTDWTNHPDLVWTLSQNGKTHVMGDSRMVETTLKDAFNLAK